MKALKATYTVEDTSMAIPKKLPNFPQRLLKETSNECRPDDDNLHSAEP